MRLVGLSGKAAGLGVYSVVTGKGGGTTDCMIVVLGIKEDLLWLCWAGYGGSDWKQRDGLGQSILEDTLRVLLSHEGVMGSQEHGFPSNLSRAAGGEGLWRHWVGGLPNTTSLTSPCAIQIIFYVYPT